MTWIRVLIPSGCFSLAGNVCVEWDFEVTPMRLALGCTLLIIDLAELFVTLARFKTLIRPPHLDLINSALTRVSRRTRYNECDYEQWF